MQSYEAFLIILVFLINCSSFSFELITSLHWAIIMYNYLLDGQKYLQLDQLGIKMAGAFRISSLHR